MQCGRTAHWEGQRTEDVTTYVLFSDMIRHDDQKNLSVDSSF